ncbi:unnamed protein product [Nesidiocoris tenuis]|uniref:Uncharacterized protein n=1 Tax=Nesidiocoris tenuis TaxID=355587 RepID=A0A6H5HHG8_9HEMI|nr:unnamed protein product [Nesidiocoris tenuis]
MEKIERKRRQETTLRNEIEGERKKVIGLMAGAQIEYIGSGRRITANTTTDALQTARAMRSGENHLTSVRRSEQHYQLSICHLLSAATLDLRIVIAFIQEEIAMNASVLLKCVMRSDWLPGKFTRYIDKIRRGWSEWDQRPVEVKCVSSFRRDALCPDLTSGTARVRPDPDFDDRPRSGPSSRFRPRNSSSLLVCQY